MLLKQTELSPKQLKAGPDDGLDEGQFQAYASVFGNVDSYGDIVEKGAFANTLKAWEESGKPIPLLFGHNFSDPDYNLGHVVKAVEDEHGLLVTAELDLENPKSAQVYRMLKGKRMDQMSFAFDVIEYEQAKSDDDEPITKLKERALHEVSVVPLGANRETEILAVKSLAENIKAGRVISAKNEEVLRETITTLRDAASALEGILPSDDEDEQDESEEASASESDEAKSGASGENPSVSDEELSKSGPSVDLLAANWKVLAMSQPTK